jgi:hypothetical protein
MSLLAVTGQLAVMPMVMLVLVVVLGLMAQVEVVVGDLILPLEA